MGDVIDLDQRKMTNEQLAEAFVVKYREARGLPVWQGKFTDLKECLGGDVKMYRYREPGKQFAIVKQKEMSDALLAAGANGASEFRMSPGASPCYDIRLPNYLWQYIS